MANVYNDQVWQAIPEMYDYARQVVIPGDGIVQSSPWAGFLSSYSYSSDGRISGMVTKLLDMAARGNKLGELRKSIETAIEKHPEWVEGPAFLAIVHMRQGDAAGAKRLIESQINADPPVFIPGVARWIIGQEIDSHAELRPLAIKLYEQSPDEDGGMRQFQYSPLNRLVKLHEDRGQS